MMENNLYNPAAQPKDWLITNFVARTQVFSKLFKDLSTGNMKYPEQHYLIQGQRGMGKTTLLLRLKYEIENTPELNKWLVPVFFNEESYDVTTLSNLWEKLLKYLDVLWETGGEYYDKTEDFIGGNGYENQCFELLIGILKEKKRKLVIFFDNFGQLFLDELKEKEQHRLREILMNCNDIRIIGASAVVLQDLHDYSKPFFEFFKIINLEGLNKDETFQLIAKLQENCSSKIDLAKNKAKIETLAILTGGVIRTIMLIYEVILADEDGTALRDLETILDRITPLYKHRMEDMPLQQRKIVNVIAKAWDAVSTKEIAENIREDGMPMATKLISAQLQQLKKNNVIEKKLTNTKNHLYQLKERFFNIWYLMRNGDRGDRRRVIWLTRFLESWYANNEDIEDFVKRHIELLNSGKYYAKSAIMVAEALTYSSKVDFVNQAMLIDATEAILNEEEKKLLPQVSLYKYEKAIELSTQYKFDDAIKCLESISQTSNLANSLLVACYLRLGESKKAITSIKADNKMRSYLLGLANFQLRDYNKAIKNLEEALNVDDVGLLPRELIHRILGDIYETGKGDDIKAIKHYEAAIGLGDGSVYRKIIGIFIKNEAYETAGFYYLKAIESGNISDRENYRPLIILLSGIYIDKKNKSKALEMASQTTILKFSLEYMLKAIIYTWNDQFKEAFDSIRQYFKTRQIEQNPLNDDMQIEFLILLLISKRQYHFSFDLFEDEKLDLKDKFKPIYYALMQYLVTEYPNEHLKMGAELQQPVNDIIEKIKQMAIDYA